MRVALLTTGQTERLGLPQALASLFPAHDFVAIDDVPGRPFRGFTSASLPIGSSGTPTALDKLIARAANLVDPAGSERYDLVVLVDDLELANRMQPNVVGHTVRVAAQAHLNHYAARPARQAVLASALRERVSFHLAVPMIESWFFAAPHAWTALGVSGKTSFHLHPGDVEAFQTSDRSYLQAQATACTAWCRRRRPKGDRPKWIGAGSDRIYHPKGYLQWLLLDPTDKTCSAYREGSQGASALAGLKWSAMLGDPNTMTFARALVEDLSDGLGAAPSLPSWKGLASPITSIFDLPPDPVLRNC